MWTEQVHSEERFTSHIQEKGSQKTEEILPGKINIKGDIIVIFTHIKGIRHFLLFLRMKDTEINLGSEHFNNK